MAIIRTNRMSIHICMNLGSYKGTDKTS